MLNSARDQAGKAAQSSLDWNNNIVKMATSGSKGSPINISQVGVGGGGGGRTGQGQGRAVNKGARQGFGHQHLRCGGGRGMGKVGMCPSCCVGMQTHSP